MIKNILAAVGRLRRPKPAVVVEAALPEKKKVPKKLVNSNFVLRTAADMPPSVSPAWDLVFKIKELRPDKTRRTIVPVIERLVQEGKLVKIRIGPGIFGWEIREDTPVPDTSESPGSEASPRGDHEWVSTGSGSLP